MTRYDIRDLAERIKSTSAPVVLFGAGSYGKIAHYALAQLGIPLAYFCDSDDKRHGTSYCGVEVIAPERLPSLGSNVQVFISSNFLVPIIATLENLNVQNVYDCVSLLEAVDYSAADIGMDVAEIKRKIFTHKNAIKITAPIDDGKLELRMIDVEITEACTMKCKDCSNLMQYYTRPKNSDLDLLLKSFDKIAQCVSKFCEVRVLGGEPFLNKQIHAIIDKIVSYPNVEKVAVFTNATIVPKDANLSCLQNEKVFLDITNYGVHSKNHDKLVEVLKENDISYVTHPPQKWTDSAKIEYVERSPADLADMFTKCCVNDILTLLNGKLYRCPFSANAMNMRAIPHVSEDYVDLADDGKDLATIKREVHHLYTQRAYISACNFCNGRDYMTPEVEPAVQTKTVLPLKQIY
jgi:organic radical activating enzyme